jgi:hypothetical protein
MRYFRIIWLYGIVTVSIALFLSSCDYGGTHSDATGNYWSVGGPDSLESWRIYSGTGETVLLSILVYYCQDTPNYSIEILVNGSTIPDGMINGTVTSSITGQVLNSRSFKLLKVKTIDITRKKEGRISGHYSISVNMK